MSTLLIIDFNNTVIRSLAVNKDLSWEGVPTGGIFGFVTQVTARIHEYAPDHLLVCSDKPPYLRKDIFPDYKKKPPKVAITEEEKEQKEQYFEALQLNLEYSRTFLEIINVPIWQLKGLEADDLIAYIIRNKVNEYDKIIVLSNDDDLNQLLIYPNVYFHKRKKQYGYDEFKEDHPYAEPADWVQLSALSGTHNAVPGIHRVGLKTAAKILSDPSKRRKTMLEHKALYERNLKLIQLPYPFYQKPVRLPTLATPVLIERDLMSFLNSLGIQYTGRMMEAFSEYSHRRPA